MSELPRRNFAKHLLLGAAVVGVGGKAIADDDNEADLVERSESDLILALVQKRFPDKKLTAKVLMEIGGDIRNDLRRSRVLRSYRLTNADEPAPTFAAYRAEPN